MKGTEISIVISGGEISGDQQRKLEAFVQAHENVKLIARPLGCTRTLEQNAYYWKVVIPKICDQFWWGKQEAHEFVKHNILADRDTVLDYCTWIDEDPIVFAVKLLEYVNEISTSTLSDEEFSQKMKEVRTFFSKAENGGIWIPAPGEQDVPPFYP